MALRLQHFHFRHFGFSTFSLPGRHFFGCLTMGTSVFGLCPIGFRRKTSIEYNKPKGPRPWRGARPALMMSGRVVLLSYLLSPLLSRAPHPGRGCRRAWALPLKPAPWLAPAYFLQLLALATLLSRAPHPGRGCTVARALSFTFAPWAWRKMLASNVPAYVWKILPPYRISLPRCSRARPPWGARMQWQGAL